MPATPDMIQLEWQQRDSDYPFRANQLSDGTLRFICLATALLQPVRPPTVLFDEPELGLHPYALTLLGNLMHGVDISKQIIISTQSAPLLNEFAPGGRDRSWNEQTGNPHSDGLIPPTFQNGWKNKPSANYGRRMFLEEDRGKTEIVSRCPAEAIAIREPRLVVIVEGAHGRVVRRWPLAESPLDRARCV